MDLKIILDGCLAKETHCQKLFYEQFYGYALRIALRYIHQHEQSVSVVNDCFAKFFIRIDSFKIQEEYNFEAAVKNLIKNLVVFHAIDKLSFTPSNTPHQIFNQSESNPVFSKDQSSDINSQLISHLRSLHPWHRVLFNMHVIDGFSLQEIADHFKISANICKSDLSQARIYLQELVNKGQIPFSTIEKRMPVAYGSF